MMFVELASAKAESPDPKFERERLKENGWEVRKHRGRYYIKRQLPAIEDFGKNYFGKTFFALVGIDDFPEMYTEIFSVEFRDVKCRSVNHILGGTLNPAIMVDPTDPIHTRLFHFALAIDMTLKTIKVIVSNKQLITIVDLETFEKLLLVCSREFYTDKLVFFNTRKGIGIAKRRHLTGASGSWNVVVGREKAMCV